jgi:hypothetical protein
MRYDVCLSFAGEDRLYVEKVADLLQDRNVRVFYDLHELAFLWGKDLYSHLDKVYRQSARYCILFASQHYAAKLWTNHERVSAQARAFSEAEEYVLPARFDDTEIPGLRPTIGYVDLRHVTPDQLVEIICQKLEISDSKEEGSAAQFLWLLPEIIETNSGTARIPFYQCVPLAEQLAGLADTVVGSLLGLHEQRREEAGSVFWTHGEDRRFDRLYATASVATALLQLGIPLDGDLIAGPMLYLQGSDPADINARAATVFRLLAHELNDVESLRFVRTLAGNQIKDADSPFSGSFLLAQGDSRPRSMPKEIWSPSPVHAGGASFHACHIADVLLHIPPEHTEARKAAMPVLEGIRGFLIRTLRAHDGWLVDLEGMRTPQTLYGLALCRPLSIPLPRDWPDIGAKALALLRDGEHGLATRCFGAMNAAYLLRSGRSEAFAAAAESYARFVLASLEKGSEVRLFPPRDIALVLRCVLSALDVVNQSLGSVICRHAVTTAWRLGLNSKE